MKPASRDLRPALPDLEAELGRELKELETAGLYRRPKTLESPPGPWTTVEGRRVLLLSSNNYLGLAGHSRIIEAGIRAAAEWGVGSGASRLICGTTSLHREAESVLAGLKGAEDAVLFATGYMANLGAISALAGPGDLILSDSLNHASLIDGCRLSRAAVSVYDHLDTEHLGRLLRSRRAQYRRCLIVTDGVFSMDGDLAPLPEICRLGRGHGAWVMVDDAHATGVLGDTGGGTVEHFGLKGQVEVQMGTLSKGLGVEGGFIAGSRTLAEYLRHRSRSYIYSTAPSLPVVASIIEAVRLVQAEPWRRSRLLEISGRLRRGLERAGLTVGGQPSPGAGTSAGIPAWNSPIIPVVAGSSRAAVDLAAGLLEAGVLAPAIRPPTVPEGTARIRLAVSAHHSDEDIEIALSAIVGCARGRGLIA